MTYFVKSYKNENDFGKFLYIMMYKRNGTWYTKGELISFMIFS